MKIAITGPLADKNLGDYGMFLNNLYDLSSEHEYTVFSYNSTFVQSLQKDFLLDFNLEFIEVSLKQIKNEKLNILDEIKVLRRKVLSLDSKTYPTPLEVINRCGNYEEIKNKIIECDVLVVSGGGYFNDLWYNWKRNDDLFKIIIPIIFASFLKKKIVFTANGYGPFDDSSSFYSMIFAEAKEACFGCRDEKLSPLYLSNIGVKNYIPLPDDLYLINDKLCISNTSEVYSNYIIIELYGSIREFSKNLVALKNIVNFFEKKNINVIFMPFDINRETEAFIKENIKNDNFIFYETKEYLKINDAVNIIKNANFVICNRYHALVLSVTNKTPVINVIKSVGDYRYYYNKNAGFLDNAFGSENIDYNFFIKSNLDDVYSLIEFQYDIFCEKQNDLYSLNIYLNNKNKLKEKRMNFIADIISEVGK
ncbi:MAG: polysaccharide pyruvyl transferase family protein [Pseudoalteromonas sp.]